MRKIFLFIILIFIIFLASCSKEENIVDDEAICGNAIDKFYIDDEGVFEERGLKLEINKPSCYGSNNYSLSISVDITNESYETKTFYVKNVKLVKEDTKAEYTVNYTKSSKLEAEMESTLTFSAQIPSNINNDKYYLRFGIHNYCEIQYYMYEKPNELRTNRTVQYYIQNEVVKTDTVKDGRTITDAYVYESIDNLYYCDTWYLDSNHTTKLTDKTIITEDTNLYGVKLTTIKWLTTSSDLYSFVEGINHTPSNGILNIPRKYMNKEICIGNYAIKDINVSVIYIPDTVHVIYGGNFTGISNATIYYEGSEDEWKALFYSQSDVITQNVVYNLKTG